MKGKAKETRSDSWEAQLTEVQQWELYYKAKQLDTWVQAARWAAKEYGLKKTPGMTAFYRWQNAMRALEVEQQAKETTANCATAAAIGKHALSDKELIAVLESLGTEAALNGDVAGATILFRCVLRIKNCIFREAMLEVKKCAREIRKERWGFERRRFELEMKREEAKQPAPRRELTPEERERNERKIREIYGLDDSEPIH